MKSLLASLLILACPTLSFCQAGADPGVDGADIRQSGGKSFQAGGHEPKSANKNLITGHCFVVESESNPMNSACVDVPLTLFDESGKTITQVRTDKKGYFEINIDDPNAVYHFGPSSQSYEMVGATRSVQGGNRALVKLRIKTQ
jgi:hypothetical protein